MVSKMNEWVLILAIIAILALSVGVLLVLVVWKRKKVGKIGEETNYQAFFIMGVSFIGLGIALTATVNVGFLGFIALGIIYLIIGLANRDKWKKKE
jgi:4-amino-4-deoxy-L-arabinose transferase-like glycosyltransferase